MTTEIMPHRFEPILPPVMAMVCGSISMMTSATLAILPGEDLPLIIDNEKMRLICVIGAIGGGLLSAILFSPPKTSGKGFAMKVFSSSLAGILFTPGVIHWLGWRPNVDVLLAVSAAFAMVSVGALKVAIPLWERIAAKKISPPDDPTL